MDKRTWDLKILWGILVFLGGILLFPLLFTAAAAFAAEPFCDVTASLISITLFLRFTPRLLDRCCARPAPRDGASADVLRS